MFVILYLVEAQKYKSVDSVSSLQWEILKHICFKRTGQLLLASSPESHNLWAGRQRKEPGQHWTHIANILQHTQNLYVQILYVSLRNMIDIQEKGSFQKLKNFLHYQWYHGRNNQNHAATSYFIILTYTIYILGSK